ncbi:hypothetical protein NUM_22900 [Actinocatenispora comari]|uniref:Uncharacterized protein n=1 Tax=Actinocatenispora comari TaxID=2807577 RepID=A0A8J4EK55_9ACTN|nr:hypothetical protein NUM_22900 [Actinocatenispora comari]
MPISTGNARYLVANVNAINCDLSPSSATKITAKLSANALQTAVMSSSRSHRTEACETTIRHSCQIEGLARPTDRAARPGCRCDTGGQSVDRDIGGYSPSRRQP